MSTAPIPAPWPEEATPRRRNRLSNPNFRPEGMPPRCMRPRRANDYWRAATVQERRFLENCQRWFRGKAINPKDQYSDIKFQAGYADIWRHMPFGCKKTVKRMMVSLRSKHFLTCLEVGVGDRKTWWILHRNFDKVLAARNDDDRIWKDNQGSKYVRGRTKQFLNGDDGPIWKINERLETGEQENDAEVPPTSRGTTPAFAPLPEEAVRRIHADYETFTGHRWKQRDTAYLNKVSEYGEEIIRCGLTIAVLRNQNRTNSFHYAIGAIHETAQANAPQQAESIRKFHRAKIPAHLEKLGIPHAPSAAPRRC